MKVKVFITGLLMLSLILLLSSNVYAINIDGNIDDWINIPVFIDDRVGDIDVYRQVTDGTQTDTGAIKITGRSYQYDVKEIKIANDPDNLYILIELAHDLDYYFRKNKEFYTLGGSIGKFYIDTDNNRYTGEEEIFTKLTGFEKELGVVVSTTLNYEYSVSYWLDLLPFYFSKRYKKDSSEDKDYIAIAKNFIEMKIPLQEIEISQGQTIRVIFSEAGARGSFAEQFSEEMIKKIE